MRVESVLFTSLVARAKRAAAAFGVRARDGAGRRRGGHRGDGQDPPLDALRAGQRGRRGDGVRRGPTRTRGRKENGGWPRLPTRRALLLSLGSAEPVRLSVRRKRPRRRETFAESETRRVAVPRRARGSRGERRTPRADERSRGPPGPPRAPQPRERRVARASTKGVQVRAPAAASRGIGRFRLRFRRRASHRASQRRAGILGRPIAGRRGSRVRVRGARGGAARVAVRAGPAGPKARRVTKGDASQDGFARRRRRRRRRGGRVGARRASQRRHRGHRRAGRGGETAVEDVPGERGR
mmetsp:Transcript_11482/g.49016  ORF Transcript_11482/g.49016 Transcript_11482/m.49016 type:complete len:297 (-) Transcript_11482:102-992(-)